MKIVLVPPAWDLIEGTLSTTTSYADFNLVAVNPHSGSPAINRNFVYDPMRDYLAWYTGKDHFLDQWNHEVLITEQTSKSKLWDQNELITYLEQTPGELVLAQRKNNGWLLLFISPNDKQQFTENWWATKQRRHTMYLAVDDSETDTVSLEAKVHSWCKNNLKGDWGTEHHYKSLKLCVRDDDEAVLAKLTFGASDRW